MSSCVRFPGCDSPYQCIAHTLIIYKEQKRICVLLQKWAWDLTMQLMSPFLQTFTTYLPTIWTLWMEHFSLITYNHMFSFKSGCQNTSIRTTPNLFSWVYKTFVSGLALTQGERGVVGWVKQIFYKVWIQIQWLEKIVYTSRFSVIFQNSQNCRHHCHTPKEYFPCCRIPPNAI